MCSIRLAIALFLIAASPYAFGQQAYTWTGSTSKDWNTATNWSPACIPGNNPEDQADFNEAPCAGITVSKSVEFGFFSFGYGPPCVINVAAFLQVRHGILNLSTTTRHTFNVLPGATFDMEFDGDAGNSIFFNAGDLDFSNAVGGGESTTTNQSGGTIYYGATSDASHATVINQAGATIDDSYLTQPLSIGSLSGAGDVLLGSQTLSVGALNSNATISGQIADGGFEGGTGGGLTKTGTGALTLSGANTYTGKTTVSQGSLDVESDLSHSSEVLVATGAQLSGGGNAGNLLAQSNSTIAAGNAAAGSTLSMTGLKCASAPTVTVRLGMQSGFQQGTSLQINGNLLSGFCPHLNFRFESAGVPLMPGQELPLINLSGTTDYTVGNLSYDFSHFAGFTGATGHFAVVKLGTINFIAFFVDSVGDAIFNNGFELFL